MRNLILGAIIVLATLSTLYISKNLIKSDKASDVNNSVSNEEYFSNWQDWKNKHLKFYSDDEEIYRYGVFKKNYYFIKSHNSLFQKKAYTFDLDLNEFSDLTKEEFMKPRTTKFFKVSIFFIIIFHFLLTKLQFLLFLQ